METITNGEIHKSNFQEQLEEIDAELVRFETKDGKVGLDHQLIMQTSLWCCGLFGSGPFSNPSGLTSATRDTQEWSKKYQSSVYTVQTLKWRKDK